MLYSSKYFSASEFACKCGCGFGAKEEDIAPELVMGLHLMRVLLVRPFKINSGARCVKHNTAIKGGTMSTHLPGVAAQCTPGYEGKTRAADVDTIGWHIHDRAVAIQAALSLGMRVGIATTFLHFDVESMPYYQEGIWNYGSGENSSNTAE